ncbi:proline-rich protein 36-like [Rhipicephalus sanguineus]|uniref:proline-rich protein 36-like n=1 Tax=Rhipicephalus sanguineus TaxID=34632 RepID=UPI0020C267AF|nr:proline-rich protein 36-like [Rhipicephalus sanguineus]
MPDIVPTELTLTPVSLNATTVHRSTAAPSAESSSTEATLFASTSGALTEQSLNQNAPGEFPVSAETPQVLAENDGVTTHFVNESKPGLGAALAEVPSRVVINSSEAAHDVASIENVPTNQGLAPEPSEGSLLGKISTNAGAAQGVSTEAPSLTPTLAVTYEPSPALSSRGTEAPTLQASVPIPEIPPAAINEPSPTPISTATDAQSFEESVSTQESPSAGVNKPSPTLSSTATDVQGLQESVPTPERPPAAITEPSPAPSSKGTNAQGLQESVPTPENPPAAIIETSPTASSRGTDVQGLQDSVLTPESPTVVKPSVITNAQATNETSPSSMSVPSSSTSAPSTTTENPHAVTMQTVTETVKEFSGTREHASPPDATVATQTLPTVHLPRRPHVTPVLPLKRPLFPARPPSFATTVGHRRLRPSDRVSTEGNQVQQTTTMAPETHSDINSANIPPTNENEQPSHPVIETPNIHLRRPHFPRPISGNRHATSSGKAPGRASGRRRKPGSRGGKRRTTTTPSPQDTTTAVPVFLEDTNAGPSGTAQFGARIGARVPQGTHQPVPMTEQPPTTSEPITTGRVLNRPAKPRRTKRPKTRPVTRPPGTEYNDVRYAYRAPNFASTRIAVDKETAYETTHEAYITDVAPASTTYRTKSPLVAEVTLPSTESADRSAISTVEYDEPLSDEPDSSNTEEPGQEASLLPHNVAAQSESLEGQLLQNQHNLNVDSGVSKQTAEVTRIPHVTTDSLLSPNNAATITIDNEDSGAPGTSGSTSQSFSTLSPTTSYGAKLNLGPSVAPGTSGDVARGVSHVEYSEPILTDGPPVEGHKAVTEGAQAMPVTAGEITSQSGKAVTQAGFSGPSLSSGTQISSGSVTDSSGADGKSYFTGYDPQHKTRAPTQAPTEGPRTSITDTSAGQPTSAPTANEEFFPLTPELDISRITTTTTPKPTQPPTTQKPYYPPLPNQPANPVAVFLVGEPGQEQGNTSAQKTVPETKTSQDKVVSENSSSGGLLQGPQPSETSKISEVPQYSTTKRPELAVPPSFLIPSNPPQSQAAVYGQTRKPGQLTQPNPAAVATYATSTDSLAGTSVNRDQQNTAVSYSAQTSRAPYTTVRPQSTNTGAPTSETSVSGLSTPLQGNAAPPETRPRLPPSAFSQHPSSFSNVSPNGPSNTHTIGTLAKQPSAEGVPPNTGVSTKPQSHPSASTTKYPISSTNRPRVPPSYVPQPAFLEPLGLQVQPFIVSQVHPNAQSSQPQKQTSYFQSLGLELSKYQLPALQLPAGPTQNRDTATAKTQAQSVQGSRVSAGQTQQTATSGAATGPSRPTYNDGAPIRPNLNQAKRRPNVSQGPQTQPAYIQSLGLQVPYLPEAQGHTVSNAAASPRLPQLGVLVPQITQPALSKPTVPQRPQVAAAKSQPQTPQTFVSGQTAGRIPLRGAGQYVVGQPVRQNKPGPGSAPARIVPSVAQAQSFVAPKAPQAKPGARRPPVAPTPSRASKPSEASPIAQQPRPISVPQGQAAQRPHIGQAHTRIYFSPPVPTNKNGLKQPPLPVAPFFLSIRHDQVVQENGPFPDVGNILSLKQTIPDDIVLPAQKASQPTRVAVAPKKSNAASERPLQIPQTPRPTRVQAQKATVSAPVPAAKKPSLFPSYAPQSQQPGIVRQIILSPATGPIPYQPKSVVPASQPPTQQGTQGVYKVSTYVPVASASLPGRPGLTATSYVPTTPDGQVLRVTSVAKPVPSTVNQANKNGVQGAVVSAASSPGVSGEQKSVSPAAAAQTSTTVPVGGAQVQGGSAANVLLPQGLVQAPQQQVVQVTSYTPQGSPQFQQTQPTYVQQVPAQQAYTRGQQPGLGLQVPVFYAAGPLPSGQVQYHPSAAGLIRQYSPQQFQTVYAVPRNVRTSGASALRASQPVYVARGNPALQAAVAGTGKAPGFAPIVYARPPVTLVERRPYYAFQQPVYVAASPQQPAQGAPTLTGAGNQLQQPLTLSVG